MTYIATWRKNLGMLRCDAAVLLGLSRDTLWRYENGRIPTPRVVRMACEGFELLCRIRAGAFGPRNLVSEIEDYLRHCEDNLPTHASSLPILSDAEGDIKTA
jgi:transcriptional regulator with XRE-family HTH domain